MKFSILFAIAALCITALCQYCVWDARAIFQFQADDNFALVSLEPLSGYLISLAIGIRASWQRFHVRYARLRQGSGYAEP
jgi:hypothetical protein